MPGAEHLTIYGHFHATCLYLTEKCLLAFCINMVLAVIFLILVKWQLYPFKCSGPKPWCHTLYLICGKIPLVLPSKYTQCLTDSDHWPLLSIQASLTRLLQWYLWSACFHPGLPRVCSYNCSHQDPICKSARVLAPFRTFRLRVSQPLTTLGRHTWGFQRHSQPFPDKSTFLIPLSVLFFITS